MRNRFKRYRHSRKRPVIGRTSDLQPEEVLFLALHCRQALLDRIEKADEEKEKAAWVEAIAAAYASLLTHCDMHDHNRIYQRTNAWTEAVCPPSVLACELMIFLGGLSVAHPEIAESCARRGSIQGFEATVPEIVHYRDNGVEERKAHVSERPADG